MLARVSAVQVAYGHILARGAATDIYKQVYLGVKKAHGSALTRAAPFAWCTMTLAARRRWSATLAVLPSGLESGSETRPDLATGPLIHEIPPECLSSTRAIPSVTLAPYEIRAEPSLTSLRRFLSHAKND